jgi:hypothetical protein
LKVDKQQDLRNEFCQIVGNTLITPSKKTAAPVLGLLIGWLPKYSYIKS